MPVDMNKTIAEASLNNLHDIIVPDAIGFFPLAPGWYMVFILLISLFFYGSVRAYKHYKKSQYRREALKELSTYNNDSKEVSLALLDLAKRVGISAYGREKIAPIYGDDWWDFMESHSEVKVSKKLRSKIAKLLYDDAEKSDKSDFNTIKSFVTLWIKTHKVSDDV